MIKEAIAKLLDRKDLDRQETEAVMKDIMSGDATPNQISGFLIALRMKGETIDEIAGCAGVMRNNALRVKPESKRLVDTCGTGGDATGTFNISTLVAFVAAGAGLKVAKHGNRSVSSQCGSADLLEALGVKIELSPDSVARCIDEVGIGFLFAPAFHPAMKYAAAPRRELGVRTIFNILGPLTNPAFTSIQLIGVFDKKLTAPLAQVLNLLGSESAMVVHGADGMDELSTTGMNIVTRLQGGTVSTFTIEATEYGLPRANLEALKGGNPQQNIREVRELLGGKKGAKRDVILLNAAAVLVAEGTAKDFNEGINIAASTIDNGKAVDKLQNLITFSQKLD
ncbi:MAG: anthranilate phosphoribosyltransferase [Dehalococcoidia bacterium]|nr:anthranilate phosphoribosyltransferase [Dehalococcoidia bacterium]MDZ4247393.1 anthranilate phosphoribosyltransferase [Dehalococcoidia bacterium]